MRQYHDVSHFRAPYKNATVSGFGAVVESPPVPGSPPTESPPPLGGAIIEVRGGYRYIKSVERQNVLSPLLMLYAVVQHGGDPEVVTLQSFTSQELDIAKTDPNAATILMGRSAFNWVQTKESEGKVVMLTDMTLSALIGNLGAAVIVALPQGANQLYAYRANDPALLESKDNPMGALILAGTPQGAAAAEAGMDTIWWVALGVAAVGGGYLLFRKKGRRGLPPRMAARMGKI